ncbi:major facilitator superfamily domain-containing protein [Lipomyces japonicus]|uniref:major facilitator superfamily domain-containing protein n=1 Tax=Lipomyces japonicus TaxID=56871 RepID=UPI0034CD3FB4
MSDITETKVGTQLSEKTISKSDFEVDNDETYDDPEKLNIPKDWPPLAAHGPKKYYFWNFNGPAGVDLDSIATQPSVFDDPGKAQAYQPIPEYENIHRFDPLARWTWREEMNVVRKIDLRIMLWVAIMYMSLQLDRGNISQAVADNMLTDLGFSTDVFNNGNTIYRVLFLITEVPSQLISKKLGPDKWIPIQMVCWSAAAMAQYAMNSSGSFYATRALLGAFEGGFTADACLYLSYFYTTLELPVRLAYFYAALTLAQISAAFMGFGILHMRGVHGNEGWRWLFLIEGAITAFIGLLSALLMPPAPTKTASWFRGKKGWFTPREEIIMVNRVLRDDPSKGDMHNREALNWSQIGKSLMDYDIWPIYLIGLVWWVPVGTIDTYMTLTLRSLGFTTFQSILIVLPEQCMSLLTLLIISYVSQRWDNIRVYLGIFSQLWVLVCLIPIRAFSADVSKWSKYGVLTVLLSFPMCQPILVAWTSRNSNSVRTRTLSSAVYNMFFQLGVIISANIYRADDKPLYRRGNQVLIGIAAMNIVVYALAKLYYVLRNKQKAAKWNALTPAQQNEYRHTTKDEGSKRLDFKFGF